MLGQRLNQTRSWAGSAQEIELGIVRGALQADARLACVNILISVNAWLSVPVHLSVSFCLPFCVCVRVSVCLSRRFCLSVCLSIGLAFFTFYIFLFRRHSRLSVTVSAMLYM